MPNTADFKLKVIKTAEETRNLEAARYVPVNKWSRIRQVGGQLVCGFFQKVAILKQF